MKRLLFFICLILSATMYSQEKRFALVIGNAENQYGGVLKNLINDADLMATSLGELGFDITKVS